MPVIDIVGQVPGWGRPSRAGPETRDTRSPSSPGTARSSTVSLPSSRRRHRGRRFPADVMHPDTVRSALAAVANRFGTIDAVDTRRQIGA